LGKVLGLVYGVLAYVVFLASFLYAVGFVGNFLVPRTIDQGPRTDLVTALPVDLGLLAIFAIQHSVMARPGFKALWTRIIPASLERSTYVLLSSLLLFLIFWQWRPVGTVVWDVSSGAGRAVLLALFALGWTIAVASTFMISHLDFFGLRQVYRHLRGKVHEPPGFVSRGFYRMVRHPIMLGFILAFWAAPTMTLGHLVFAIATTAYILIGVRLEERDLLAMLGDSYDRYRRRVPMLIPWSRK